MKYKSMLVTTWRREYWRLHLLVLFVVISLVVVQPVEIVRAQSSPTLTSSSIYESPLCRYGVITYTLAITNPVANPETTVTVHNPIAANTEYVDGSLFTEVSSGGGSGEASYNSSAKRVEWIGTLAGGEAVSITFAVLIGLEVADGTLINNGTTAIFQPTSGNTTTLNVSLADTVDCTIAAATPPAWEVLPPDSVFIEPEASATPEWLPMGPALEQKPLLPLAAPYAAQDESPPEWFVEMFLPMLRSNTNSQTSAVVSMTPDAGQAPDVEQEVEAVQAGRYNPCTVVPPWYTNVQMDEATYQDTVNDFGSAGWRPISLSVNGVGADARFSTIWVDDGKYGDNWGLQHDLSGSEYQQAYEGFAANDFKPIMVDAYGDPADPQYAAIWVLEKKDVGGLHGATRETILSAIEDFRGAGFRPLWMTALSNGDDPQFSGLWINDGFTGTVAIDLTSSALSALAQQMTDKGYRIQQISGYDTPDGRLYTASWVLDTNCPERRWESFTDNSVNRYVFKAMTQSSISGDRDVTNGVLTINGADFAGTHYVRLALTHGLGAGTIATLREIREAAGEEGLVFDDGLILILNVRPNFKVRAEEATLGNLRMRPWSAAYTGPGQSFLMDNHQYRLVLQYDGASGKWVEMQRNEISPDYYYPIALDEVGGNDEREYASVWLAGPTTRKWTPTPLQTGALPPPSALDDFDDAMYSFMQRRGITNGSLAVTKDGKLVLAKAYTWDLQAAPKANPMQPYRIASVSKPLTAVAILRLVKDGEITLNQKLKDIPGFDAAVLDSNNWIDARIKEVTVGQLLRHIGGWDRDVSFDPMTADFDVCAGTLPPTLPTTTQGIIDWMRGEKLDHPPGYIYNYSNFGYALLGRVIEVVTGESYNDYMQEVLLDPLGMNSAALTNNLSTEPVPNEVFYLTPNNSIDADHLGWTGVFPDREICNSGHADSVPAPYGGLNLLPMDSHGGWSISAPDLARFLVEMEDPSLVLDERYRNLMWSRQEGRSLRVSLLKSINDITDYTIAARTDSNLTFPAPAASGEWLIVAKGLDQFSSIKVDVTTAGEGYELRFLYSGAGITKQLSVEDHNLVDGTNGFTQDGIISFTPPEDWQPNTFGKFDGKPRYFIAILTDQVPTTAAVLEYAWPTSGEVRYGYGWDTAEQQVTLQVAFGVPVYPAGSTVVGSVSKAQADVVSQLPSGLPLPNATNLVLDSLVGGPFIAGENLFIGNLFVGKALGRDIARSAEANHGGLLWGTRTWIVHRSDGVNFVVLFNQDNHGAYYLPDEGDILSALDDVIDDVNSTNSWPAIDLFP